MHGVLTGIGGVRFSEGGGEARRGAEGSGGAEGGRGRLGGLGAFLDRIAALRFPTGCLWQAVFLRSGAGWTGFTGWGLDIG
jgi:hypothetical protein